MPGCSFTEEVASRFLGYGWHVVRLFDVDDLAAVHFALDQAAAETERPSIVIMHSHIGIGTPLHDDHRSHGSPVGPQYAAIARGLLHWPHQPFEIPSRCMPPGAPRSPSAPKPTRPGGSCGNATDTPTPSGPP
ncbi:MAG TPA: hypothetical protein VN748_05460 [Pseudonocardiaceae bacterium]|nr:hypothetical protein [Pseudonocardiaceae bacterium]